MIALKNVLGVSTGLRPKWFLWWTNDTRFAILCTRLTFDINSVNYDAGERTALAMLEICSIICLQHIGVRIELIFYG